MINARTQIAGEMSGDELNAERKEEEKALKAVPNEWTNGLIFFLPLCNIIQFWMQVYIYERGKTVRNREKGCVRTERRRN